MYTVAFTFNHRLIAFILSFLLTQGGFALSQEDKDYYDTKYRELVAKEREQTSRQRLVEQASSGIAAIIIGMYGYYNDNRGLLTRVVYSATQTAGVVMVSDAIVDANSPSLLLSVNRYLARRGPIDMDRFKRGLVSIERRRQEGELKKIAYTSGVLSAMYFYNGYRERKNTPALSNVFLFLGGNFLLISGVGFYKLKTFDRDHLPPSSQQTFQFDILPTPTITYNF